MRNALLLAVGVLATISLVACADDPASQLPAKKSSKGKSAPAEGSQQTDDPNPVNEPGDPTNPNANSMPSNPSNPGTSTGQMGVSLSNAAAASDLGTTTDITVTVEPKGGFKGDAQLTISGLPDGVTAAFSPASVTLNTTAATSKLTLTVPTTAAPSSGGNGSALVVTAKSGATVATANANFKVNPKLTMTIPVNSDALIAAGGGTRYVDGWAGPALGTAPAALKTQQNNPIQIVVVNKDSQARIVHGNAGFAHGDTNNPVPPGGTDPKSRQVAVGAQTSGYLHGEQNNQGTAVSFRISVDEAQ
jgi:hypothetical protein